jgi:hypothetical protein
VGTKGQRFISKGDTESKVVKALEVAVTAQKTKKDKV